jgi:hypothetical protein
MYDNINTRKSYLRKRKGIYMKIINKIKAFFCKDNEPVEMDIIAAEIKEGKAFLHPKDDPGTTYLIRSDDIRISLSEGKSLQAQDIFCVSRKAKRENQKPQDPSQLAAETKPLQHDEQTAHNGNADNQSGRKQPNLTFPGFEKYKKRVFSVSLYPEEYDSLIDSMKEYGYKRADFLLACVQSARKTSMEKAHKEIMKTHKQMLVEQKELIAQQLAELDNSIPAV